MQRVGHSPYEVGYRKPPVNSRFRPGRSGNPRGRPKGSRNSARVPGPREEKLKDLILKEAYRPVSVNDAGGKLTMPMAQAVLLAIGVNAVKGSQWAQRHFTELLATTERDRKREHDEFLQEAIKYKCEWERELEYRERFGTTGPEPIPHPDDVVVDLRAGTVSFKGPMTKEDKAELEETRRRIQALEGQLAYVRNELAKEPDSDFWKAEIEADECSLALLRWNEQLMTGAHPR